MNRTADRYDREKDEILLAWSKVSLVWRIVFAFFPRTKWKSCLRILGSHFPLDRSASSWSLEEKIFNSPETMIRIGDSRWEHVQNHLRLCIQFER